MIRFGCKHNKNRLHHKMQAVFCCFVYLSASVSSA